MDLIETFGAKVGALSEAKPEKARKLLAAGFQANGLKNKLASKRASQSDKMLFQTVNKAMVNCLTKPQGNVMVSLFTPCEMLQPLLLRGLFQLPLRLQGRAAVPAPGRGHRHPRQPMFLP